MHLCTRAHPHAEAAKTRKTRQRLAGGLFSEKLGKLANSLYSRCKPLAARGVCKVAANNFSTLLKPLAARGVCKVAANNFSTLRTPPPAAAILIINGGLRGGFCAELGRNW